MKRSTKVIPQKWVKVADYNGGQIYRRGFDAFAVKVRLLSPESGERVRRSFSAKSEAECRAWLDKVAGGADGKAAQSLTPVQYAEAVEAFRLLRGRSLLATVKEAAEAYDRLKGKPMLSIIDLGLKSSKVKMQKVADAVKDYLTFMRGRVAEGLRSKKTVDGYAMYLVKFAESHGETAVHAVTAADIDRFLRDHWQNKITSRHNAYRVLSAFFSFCVKQKWVSRNDNPFAEDLNDAKQDIQDLHRHAIEDSDILYLKPDEAARLLAAAIRHDRTMVPWLLVCLFLGVRPSEASRLTGAQFHLFDEHPRLELPRQITKTKTKRTIDLAKPVFAKALEWLRAYVSLGPEEELSPWKGRNVVSKHQTDLFALADIADKRQQDILRHTAATYLAPLLADAEYVGVMGHSKEVSRVHYDAKTVEAEARDFFALSPSNLLAVADAKRSVGDAEADLRRRMDEGFAQMEAEEAARFERESLEAQLVLSDPEASDEEKAAARERLVAIDVAVGNLSPEDVGWVSAQSEAKADESPTKEPRAKKKRRKA